MIKLLNQDNMNFNLQSVTGSISLCDAIFADCIYESFDFQWTYKYWDMLDRDGIFFIMTDFHTVSEIDVHMKKELGAIRINKLVWRNEWGHPPSKKFHECYDDILIYSKSGKWRFDKDKVQVPKATAKSAGLNPSGRMTKTATAWIDGITLTTGAKERVKMNDGHLIRWQKPKELLRRIMSPFLLQNDVVVDPFAGSATAGVVCAEENWHYIGIEADKKVFKIAEKRLKPYMNDKEIIPF